MFGIKIFEVELMCDPGCGIEELRSVEKVIGDKW